ncbi:peptidoglycan-binding domain-containing protein [Streptomyces dysideae]|uniref:Peptidoglycan binding-like domain-containing protein n=1 Tax=Streptomyces dysideae TaxID=909626 RepID=A0A101V3D9_9ACTN|nr:peptidoglycan-binding protein [Streptomyces dysideae]KUO21746.1 hypothetical protein AQJ91_08220 [Streptomyces dysideae]
MNVRTPLSRATTAAVGALAAGALAISATPASASPASGYVNGGGAYSNDWSNEGGPTGHSLYNGGKYKKSNATCLWQKILWAEGVTEQNGSLYDGDDIDGDFGPNTTYATKKLQKRWGLTADGKVGPKTFGKADAKLRYVSGSTSANRVLTVRYAGRSHSFTLKRNAQGNYSFSQDGGVKLAGYKYRSCK